jgi:3-hydroxybutyryl-CoA dehydrogenase
MGQQIAMQFAFSGFSVKCTDLSSEMLEKAKVFAQNWTAKQVEKGRMTQTEAEEKIARLRFVEDLKAAAEDADFVLEAVVESLAVKRSLFSQLDAICPAHCIFATNSSYIVSSRIADATGRPDKVLNMHFFNPALVMKLVEVVRGDHVSENTVETILDLCRAIGKEPTLVKREIYGFVANRIFAAITREACFMLEQGVADIEAIDNAVKNGLGHPLGPFQLLDLTGIDLEYQVLMERFAETGDHRDKPGPAIATRYALGHYGRKNGKGFYKY